MVLFARTRRQSANWLDLSDEPCWSHAGTCLYSMTALGSGNRVVLGYNRH
jgi:uncharacterized protein YuzB (UPF0349 family)